MILASVDKGRLWAKHLSSEDSRIALDALKYLTDRRDGKAPQAIEVNDKRKSSRERLAELLTIAAARRAAAASEIPDTGGAVGSC